MTHQRNIEGLKASAQQRHEAAKQRTERGIQQLIRDGRPINFKTVAEVAQVSTAWLYQQPDIKERIIRLRQQASPRPAPLPATRASDASKDAIIVTLRQRVK